MSEGDKAMSGKERRKRHIVVLVCTIILSVFFVIFLNKVDESVSLPLIKPKEVLDIDQQQASEVDDLISTIDSPISLQQKEQIIYIRESYENLSDEAKAKVTLLDKLVDAESQLLELEDKETAKKVIDLINSLTDDFDLASLTYVRKAYDNLTEQQKDLVTNLFLLENAEKEINTIVTRDNLNIGDIVIFDGGSIYRNSYSSYVANSKGESRCKITAVSRNSDHPYHLVSVDDGGVYGWVDISNMSRE